MELNDILSSGALGLIGIVGFFLKKVLSDVERMKAKEVESKLLEQLVKENHKHIERIEVTMLKKFSSVHAREEKQREINEELKLTLVRIDEKLDLLLKDKK